MLKLPGPLQYSAHAPSTAPLAAMAQVMADTCPLRNSSAPYAVSAAISASCRATSAVPNRRLVASAMFSMGSRLQGSLEICTGVVVAHQRLFSLRLGSRQHQTGSLAAFAAILQDQLTALKRVYGGKWAETLGRGLIISTSYFSIFFVSTLLLIVAPGPLSPDEPLWPKGSEGTPSGSRREGKNRSLLWSSCG